MGHAQRNRRMGAIDAWARECCLARRAPQPAPRGGLIETAYFASAGT
jgi:hypothetical protein